MDEPWKEDRYLKVVLSKISDKYSVVDRLGGGGFASVYLIYHNSMHVKHALKILDIGNTIERQFSDNEAVEKYKRIEERFRREARLYARISHPNIVSVNTIESVKYNKIHIPYLVLEYIEGNTLKNLLKQHPALSLEKIFRVSRDVLHALDTIHKRGIIHRDIKPGNIMIRKDNGEAVLIDFGLGKDLLHETGITMTDETALGTTCYMSPEHIQHFKDLEPSTDLYSFGIVLFEMLTGECPFKGSNWELIKCHLFDPVPNVRKLNPRLPNGIEDVIFKALEKNPLDRYRGAAEFLADLEVIAGQERESGRNPDIPLTFQPKNPVRNKPRILDAAGYFWRRIWNR